MSESASHLADDDIVAVLSFLRLVPPVKNDVPPGSWGIVGKTLITAAQAAHQAALPSRTS